MIFEGEKRFDMVIRLDQKERKSIDDIQNLYVDLPNGSLIPLKEVADISYEPGPMQISRDKASRRVYVGVNVRGRDVQSLVEEIKQKLDNQVKMPTGYHVTYGGEFQNMQDARERMAIVMPIALLLIFVLLYFALKSVKQALMIYMAVPLSTIGGVLALALRGMPFSISAGVGFIVLLVWLFLTDWYWLTASTLCIRVGLTISVSVSSRERVSACARYFSQLLLPCSASCQWPSPVRLAQRCSAHWLLWL